MTKASVKHSSVLVAILSLASGTILGFSAPGFDQWYLAWIGLIPLLLLAVSRPNPGQAFWVGLGFGTAYNLVYLNWYLGLHPLTWLGFSLLQSKLVAGLSWGIVSLHQGIIIGLFAFLLKAMPLTGGFMPRKVNGHWLLPASVVIPLLWVLLENKLGNAHQLLGVPWSMLEYSQYRQLNLIQAACWIGGIGLSCVLVLFNVTFAQLIATIWHQSHCKPLAQQSLIRATCQILVVTAGLALLCFWGSTQTAGYIKESSVTVSVAQPNINIEMQKTEHRYTVDELLTQLQELTFKRSASIAIWPENSLPVYLTNSPATRATLSVFAHKQDLNLIIGALDCDPKGHPFNSVFGITANGILSSAVYHKRYLVPFGEYTPQFVEYLPEWIQQLTNTPAGTGFSSGKQPVVLKITSRNIAPLVCFETISPELVAQSVQAGGELLVNLSDLAWFHNSMIGQQMIAFSVLRAVENRRYFVFAANSGPSAIIDPAGVVIASYPQASKGVLTHQVGFSSAITPFTCWFR
ncbi:MAG: apolipoprotein N-acyltransferase [Candidatus Melainabacteria bacterium]|nr:apolipoprotein N-acyltransferase [Candidatus Melainabacteria bacterium]